MSKAIFRIDEILRYCKGKSVLHLGFLTHTMFEDAIARDEWAHGWMNKVAKRLVGIDYLADSVEYATKKYGIEGYYGDAMDLDKCALNEKFDVIVCGELIEHITNPGLMLEGLKRFMREDSILIVTTPNVFSREYLRLFRKQDETKWVNFEHVTWYSHYTLTQTLERHGYEEVNYGYYFGFATEANYVKVEKGLIGKLRLIRRKRRASRSEKRTEIGLFFVAKLGKNSAETTTK